MTPHKSHGRGSYIFDRLFDGIGRVRLASGTTDYELFRQMDAMLTSLYAQGHHDTLRALRERTIRPAVVWNAFRTNRLDKLPTADTLPPLGAPPARRRRGQPRMAGTEGVWLWLESYCTDDRARSNAISGWRNLIEHGGVDDPILNDLPRMLRTYRQHCRERRTPAMYNRTKAGVQAYVNDILGESHALYQLVSEVHDLPEPPQRQPNPQTPDEMRELYRQVGPVIGECCWAMAVTGMLPKEYWGDWQIVSGTHIHIRGRKRASRVRDVPLVYAIARPTISRSKFEDDLAAVTKGRVIPKDFRNTFAVWMSEAGIPLNRRDHYRGHSPRKMNEIYERQQVRRYLAKDGERLRTFIGEVPVARLRIAK